MTPEEALKSIVRLSATRSVRYTAHAHQRMNQRNVQRADVESALLFPSRCVPADPGRWKVTGPDADGDDLDVVVAIEDSVIVVTVF